MSRSGACLCDSCSAKKALLSHIDQFVPQRVCNDCFSAVSCSLFLDSILYSHIGSLRCLVKSMLLERPRLIFFHSCQSRPDPNLTKYVSRLRTVREQVQQLNNSEHGSHSSEDVSNVKSPIVGSESPKLEVAALVSSTVILTVHHHVTKEQLLTAMLRGQSQASAEQLKLERLHR